MPNLIQNSGANLSVANSSNFVPEDRQIVIVRQTTAKPYDYTFRIGDGETSLKELKDLGKSQTVDESLSSTSTNPVQNKAIQAELAKKASKDLASTTASGLMSATDKRRLDEIEDGANKTTIDSTLNSTSTNPVQNKVINAELSKKLNSNDLLNLVYPVGAIYLSTVSTSPQTLFGGTWERIEGRFLLGADSTYGAGSTGGEATHTLSRNEIPEHSHSFKYTGQSATTGVNAIRVYQASSTQYNAYSGGQSSNCGGEAHNNMPPYLAVYMWKRTQ